MTDSSAPSSPKKKPSVKKVTPKASAAPARKKPPVLDVPAPDPTPAKLTLIQRVKSVFRFK